MFRRGGGSAKPTVSSAAPRMGKRDPLDSGGPRPATGQLLLSESGEGRPMTETGGGTRQGYWDDARIALARVDEVMSEHREASREDMVEMLRAVENYEAIPQEVRQSLEGMSVEERGIVGRFIATLADHHFFIENGGRGGMRWL